MDVQTLANSFPDIVDKIFFEYLDYDDLENCFKVSPSWHNALKGHVMRSPKLIQHFGNKVCKINWLEGKLDKVEFNLKQLSPPDLGPITLYHMLILPDDMLGVIIFGNYKTLEETYVIYVFVVDDDGKVVRQIECPVPDDENKADFILGMKRSFYCTVLADVLYLRCFFGKLSYIDMTVPVLKRIDTHGKVLGTHIFNNLFYFFMVDQDQELLKICYVNDNREKVEQRRFPTTWQLAFNTRDNLFIYLTFIKGIQMFDLNTNKALWTTYDIEDEEKLHRVRFQIGKMRSIALVKPDTVPFEIWFRIYDNDTGDCLLRYQVPGCILGAKMFFVCLEKFRNFRLLITPEYCGCFFVKNLLIVRIEDLSLSYRTYENKAQLLLNDSLLYSEKDHKLIVTEVSDFDNYQRSIPLVSRMTKFLESREPTIRLLNNTWLGVNNKVICWNSSNPAHIHILKIPNPLNLEDYFDRLTVEPKSGRGHLRDTCKQQ